MALTSTKSPHHPIGGARPAGALEPGGGRTRASLIAAPAAVRAKAGVQLPRVARAPPLSLRARAKPTLTERPRLAIDLGFQRRVEIGLPRRFAQGRAGRR